MYPPIHPYITKPLIHSYIYCVHTLICVFIHPHFTNQSFTHTSIVYTHHSVSSSIHPSIHHQTSHSLIHPLCTYIHTLPNQSFTHTSIMYIHIYITKPVIHSYIKCVHTTLHSSINYQTSHSLIHLLCTYIPLCSPIYPSPNQSFTHTSTMYIHIYITKPVIHSSIHCIHITLFPSIHYQTNHSLIHPLYTHMPLCLHPSNTKPIIHSYIHCIHTCLCVFIHPIPNQSFTHTSIVYTHASVSSSIQYQTSH